MAVIGAWAQDILTRVYNVHWDTEEEQQALLQIGDSAVALDTGESFHGIATGASGTLKNDFTVLSSGVVVYGTPRDGDPCFMACTDGITIRRGSQADLDDPILWETVFIVPAEVDSGWGLTALSFAGDAFFVGYQISELELFYTASFDGIHFKAIGNPYADVPTTASHAQQVSGSVAKNGEVYATVGIFSHQDNFPEIITTDNNMMWSMSNDGRSWDSGFSYPEIANPGIRPDWIDLGSDGGRAYTTVAGGAGIFVAAGTVKSAFKRYTDDVIGDTSQNIHPTAAAVVSSDGSSWHGTPLPGAFTANYEPVVGGGLGTVTDESVSLSVAFIKQGDNGYFVISANGTKVTSGDPLIAGSWCWKGDGHTWDMVKHSDAADFGVVSAIAKDLSSTTIVTI